MPLCGGSILLRGARESAAARGAWRCPNGYTAESGLPQSAQDVTAGDSVTGMRRKHSQRLGGSPGIAGTMAAKTNTPQLIISIAPILVEMPTAAAMLAMSESRLRQYLRLGMITARYNGAKPSFLVSELVKFAENLPSREWRLMPL